MACCAVRRRRPAGPAPARTPRRPSRAAAPVAPVGAAVVPRRAGAAAGCLAFSSAFYGVYARRPRAAPAGAVGRTGRLAYGAGFMLSGLLGARLIERLGRAALLALGAAVVLALRRAALPAAHRRRLGRGLAAVPEPAGAAAVARPPRGTRRGAGPEHLRHLPGRQPGTAVAGTLYTHAGFATLALSASGASRSPRWDCTGA